MFRTLGFGVFVAVALAAGGAQAASCAASIKGIAASAGGLKVEFIRPVIVSRGGQSDGAEVLDIVTEPKIDGQLRCRGEAFYSFTARIPAASNANVRDAFFRLQQAALIAVLQWSPSKASATLLSMTAEAADYLRASIERGDVEVAGKVEEHAGAAGDIGLFWTRTEREFILISEP